MHVEYFQETKKNEIILALEYFPERADILIDNPDMRGKQAGAGLDTSTLGKKSRITPCLNNYILKLTEWKAWWTMATRLPKRAGKNPLPENPMYTKEALLRSNRAQSETEKFKFFKKYYFDKPSTVTPRPENCGENQMAVPMHDNDAQPILNGSLTPRKKNRENTKFMEGKRKSCERPKIRTQEEVQFNVKIFQKFW